MNEYENKQYSSDEYSQKPYSSVQTEDYVPVQYPNTQYSEKVSNRCLDNEVYDYNDHRCVSKCPATSVFCIGCTEPKCININNEWKWKCAPLCESPAPAHNCKCVRKTITNERRTYVVTQYTNDLCGWQCDELYQPAYEPFYESSDIPHSPCIPDYKQSDKDYYSSQVSKSKPVQTSTPKPIQTSTLKPIQTMTSKPIQTFNKTVLGPDMWLPDSTTEDLLKYNSNGNNKLFCACVTTQWEKPLLSQLKDRVFFKSEYRNANKHCEKIAGNYCRATAVDHGATKTSVKAVALRHSCGGECPKSGNSLGCHIPSIFGCGGRGRMKLSNGKYAPPTVGHLILDGRDIFSYKCTAK